MIVQMTRFQGPTLSTYNRKNRRNEQYCLKPVSLIEVSGSFPGKIFVRPICYFHLRSNRKYRHYLEQQSRKKDVSHNKSIDDSGTCCRVCRCQVSSREHTGKCCVYLSVGFVYELGRCFQVLHLRVLFERFSRLEASLIRSLHSNKSHLEGFSISQTRHTPGPRDVGCRGGMEI